MRNKFDKQLETLNEELTNMGTLIESAISNAVKAFTEHSPERAEETIEFDRQVDEKEKEIESLCLKLLLQQQPVARDLRTISSALKMITDMERIGDQASDIAEIALIINGECSLVRGTTHISQMAEATIRMVNESIDAFVKKDMGIAVKVIQDDDIVDNLFNLVKADLIELIAKNPEKGEPALDFLMIAKYLERIGDHATNIAEWVLFSITGEHEIS